MNERDGTQVEQNGVAAAESTGSSNQYFGTAKQVVERYTHCAICGANLHFTHVTDFAKNLTQENSRCPECGIKARSVLHRLQ